MRIEGKTYKSGFYSEAIQLFTQNLMCIYGRHS